jgi:DnaJ homolog subfamily C member 2
MASVVELPPVSISLPADRKPTEATASSLSGWFQPLSELTELFNDFNAAPIRRRLLPTGAAYHAHVRRTVHKRTFDEDEVAQAEEARRRAQSNVNGDDKNGTDDLGVGDEEETVDLLLLDPKEWKVQ